MRTYIRRILNACLILMPLLSIFGCTGMEKLIGQSFNPNSQMFCQCSSDHLPAICTTYTGDFSFTYTISNGNQEGEYVIEGQAQYLKSVFPEICDLSTGICNSRFFLLLGKERVIMDYVGFGFYGTASAKPLRFERKTFKSNGFDAVGMAYKVTFID